MYETDIGYLSKDNLIYLASQGVLTKGEDGSVKIKYNIVESEQLSTPIQMYSLFRQVVENIKELTGEIDIDKIVGIMRNGEGPDGYQSVVSVKEGGIRLALSGAAEKGVKKF